MLRRFADPARRLLATDWEAAAPPSTAAALSRSFSSSASAGINSQRKFTGNKDFKTYKPITPGMRGLRLPINDHLYKGRAYLPLTIPKRKTGGRNNSGRITVRHIGGGHKQRLRKIDFFRKEYGEQVVLRIEYDPGRSAHIALIEHKETKAKSYILAPEGLRAGDIVQSFRAGVPRGTAESELLDEISKTPIPPLALTDPSAPQSLLPPEPKHTLSGLQSAKEAAASTLELGFLRQLCIKPGNHLPIRLIPPGTPIHNVSLTPFGKSVLVRSAGTSAKVIQLHTRGGDYAHVRLQSGEVRFVHMDACATIGSVSNRNWQGKKLGKAGRARNLGIRPTVRGVAMNKRDHPMGGGRGKSKSNKQAVSPTGVLAKGGKTRRNGPRGNRMVVIGRTPGKHVGRGKRAA